jgi:vancomycin permeability regulator SanA
VTGAARPEVSVGTLLRTAGVMVAGTIVASEYAHWRSSKWYLPDHPPSSGPCALVVLGFPTRFNGEPHPVQIWRVDLARRAFNALGVSKVVFSGGPSKGRPAEAEAMAAYARQNGIPPEVIEVETAATSTWQNVQFSLPLVRDYARVAFVSDPLHAARARRYLRAQDPELANRLVSAGEYQLLEHCWLKIAFVAYEMYIAVRGTLRAQSISEGAPPTLAP